LSWLTSVEDAEVDQVGPVEILQAVKISGWDGAGYRDRRIGSV
jgi:hypothetical protein